MPLQQPESLDQLCLLHPDHPCHGDRVHCGPESRACQGSIGFALVLCDDKEVVKQLLLYEKTLRTGEVQSG